MRVNCQRADGSSVLLSLAVYPLVSGSRRALFCDFVFDKSEIEIQPFHLKKMPNGNIKLLLS